MTDCRKSALEYAARGWAVFPLSPGQKIPPKGSRGLLDATKDSAAIERFWAALPSGNVGIATGAISGLFVLDIDPRHGGDKVFIKLQEKYGEVPDTVTVATGGGGVQFYFKYRDGLRNTANKIGAEFAEQRDSRGHTITGIDTRGDGGYVAAPPSLHPSGGVYRFYDGRETLPLADLPDWLYKLASVRADGPRLLARPDYFRDLFARGAGEGERNDAVARMAGYLFRTRIDPMMVHDLVSLWNQQRIKPPLSQDEVDTTINSVAGKELARLQKKRGK